MQETDQPPSLWLLYQPNRHRPEGLPAPVAEWTDRLPVAGRAANASSAARPAPVDIRARASCARSCGAELLG